MAEKNNPAKTAVFLIGLAGAVYFALTRILDDGSNKTKIIEKTPAQVSAAVETENSNRPKAGEATPEKLKAKTEEDYFTYDPMGERILPNEALYAVASRPSPFGSGWTPAASSASKGQDLPNAIQQLRLQAVLSDHLPPYEAVAIINSRTYRVGEQIENANNEALIDPAYGSFRVEQITKDSVKIAAKGESFTLSIEAAIKDFIDSPGNETAKKNRKKTE